MPSAGLLPPITPHFWRTEFDLPAKKAARYGLPGAIYPLEWVAERLRPLCVALEVVRAELGGRPITVHSGYRTPKYNAARGGAPDSQHLHGRAADFEVSGVAPRQVYARIRALHAQGALQIGGLGLYATFVHLDTRPRGPGQALITWGER